MEGHFPLSVSLSFEGFEIGREGEILAYNVLWRKLIERIDAFVFLLYFVQPVLVWVYGHDIVTFMLRLDYEAKSAMGAGYINPNIVRYTVVSFSSPDICF